MLYLIIFAIGLAVLYFGALALLKGAVQVARSLGIPPLVIGMTLVAFGTSAPELSLDVTAAFRDSAELAFGDLVGSNIANIGLILGVAAVIRPLKVHGRVLVVEIPIVIAVSLGLWILAYNGFLDRREGLLMVIAFLVFMIFTYYSMRAEPEDVRKEIAHTAQVEKAPIGKSLLFIFAGLAALVIGSQFMVYAAVALARSFGISEVVIGLTIVAIGTSLPELAASAVAAKRGEADIAIGNVVGSNICNILLVMGVVAIIRPFAIPEQSLRFDVPIMTAFAAALVPIILRGRSISRLEGAMLLLAYGMFLGWQIRMAGS